METNCESRWKKMIGKPYSGELNVRFDEGELEKSMDELLRHCQTKGAETDRLTPKILRQFSTLPLCHVQFK